MHRIVELGGGESIGTSSLLAAGGATLFFTESIGGVPVATLWSARLRSSGEWEVRPLHEFGHAFLGDASEVGSGVLFVIRRSGSPARELWISDGTESGTASLEVSFSRPTYFVQMSRSAPATHAFLVASSDSGSVLWVTDGTQAGTRALASSAFEDAYFDAANGGLAVVGSSVYFVETSFAGADSLRVESLATTEPAVHLVDFCSGGSRSWPGGLFASVSGRLLFDDCAGSSEQIWAAEPDSGTVRQVTDFCDDSCSIDPYTVFTSPDRIVFGVREIEDWPHESVWTLAERSDDATRLSAQVWHLEQQRTPPLLGAPLEIAAGHGLFAVSDGKRGVEPWTTDFTRASLAIAADLRFDAPGGSFGSFLEHGPDVFFVDRDSEDRSWRLDGSTGAVRHLLDSQWGRCSEIPNGQVSALPVFRELLHGVAIQLDDCSPTANLWAVTEADGEALPLLQDSDHPEEVFDGLQAEAYGVLYLGFYGGLVWQTDGSAEGTRRLAAVEASDRVAPLGAAGDKVIVGAFGATGTQDRLVTVDTGTGASASLAPITVASSWSASAGGRVYLLARSSSGNSSLWSSDGTVAGTYELAPLSGWGQRVIDWMEVEGGHLLFVESEPDHDIEAVFTAGLPIGTHAAGSFPATQGSEPPVFAEAGRALVGGSLRLQAYDAELHAFVSILESTDALDYFDVSPGSALSDGWIYFTKRASGPVLEVWKTLGTAASTSRVARLPVDAFAATMIASVDGNRLLMGWRSPSGDDRLGSLDLATGELFELEVVRPVPFDPFQPRQSGAALPDQWLFAGVDADHGAEIWQTDGTAAETRLLADLNPGPASSSPGDFFVAGDRVFFSADDGVHGRELWTLRVGDTVPCRASERTLCLDHDRFKVDLHYMDFQGNQGDGAATALSADTGYFTFFDPANVESVVKVLDGTGTNGHHWVFEGALTNLQTFLTVTDTATGEAKRYLNGLGAFASIGDPAAFLDAGAVGPAGSSASASVRESSRRDDRPAMGGEDALPGELGGASGHCAPASNRLCLQGNRFAVEASWSDFFGGSGVAMAVPLTADTGYFWFFADSNVETMVKVLDGRGTNGRFWVFFGALSNVEYTLTVTDTETGEIRTYFNPLGRFASVGDVDAF
ncbi:MAG: hypothetical protein U0X73_06810 [Thermoanaerobaculia bacterium]